MRGRIHVSASAGMLENWQTWHNGRWVPKRRDGTLVDSWCPDCGVCQPGTYYYGEYVRSVSGPVIVVHCADCYRTTWHVGESFLSHFEVMP